MAPSSRQIATLFRTVFATVGLLALSAGAQTVVARGPTIGYFDTGRDPDFGPATVPLRRLMAEAKIPRGRIDAFCIVGYRYPDAGKIVYVHWPRERKLILWDGGNAPDALVRSRRSLDLRKDVVATDSDIGGSTYLVTRPWVAQTIADCARHGRQYRVARPRPRR